MVLSLQVVLLPPHYVHFTFYFLVRILFKVLVASHVWCGLVYAVMEDDLRAVLVSLGDSAYLLCHLAWRDISTLAFDIEPCVHVEILAKLVSRYACLLQNVNKLPMLLHHTNLSDPVGNLMCPFKAGAPMDVPWTSLGNICFLGAVADAVANAP